MNDGCVDYDQRLGKFFSAVAESQDVPILIEFAMAIAPSNASTERVFSKIKVYWSDSKSNLSLEMLQSAMQTKVHHNQNCDEFVKWLEIKPELLKDIQSIRHVQKKRPT